MYYAIWQYHHVNDSLVPNNACWPSVDKSKLMTVKETEHAAMLGRNSTVDPGQIWLGWLPVVVDMMEFCND
jgi:hypothetical protein